MWQKGFGYQKLQADLCLDVLMKFLAVYDCTFCFDFSRYNMDVSSYKITFLKIESKAGKLICIQLFAPQSSEQQWYNQSSAFTGYFLCEHFSELE